MPRSFFSADHHDNTRSGKARGFTLDEIWDLKDVSPLFRIPSCVLFAHKSVVNYALPETGLSGKSFSGALSAHNQNLQTAAPLLTETATNWFYRKQGNSSAFSSRESAAQNKTNPYKKLFKQGATIVPRTFYFVELNQATPPDFEDRIINIKTAESVKPDAKQPWKEINFSGRIESRFLFRTALSKSILPFSLLNPNFVVLPITIENNKVGDKKIKLHSAADLLEDGFLNAAKWFQKVENEWDSKKTEKSLNMTSNNRLDFQSGIVEQNLNAPYLVLYNSSAKDANATVVKRDDLDLSFVVESKAYVLYTNSLNEAYYLAAIFNSTAPNKMMKDFQTRGLFGARDVHKKILDIYYPKFDATNEQHLQLAELSEAAHVKTSAFLAAAPPHAELTALRLGKLRLDIKKHLVEEVRQIDEIVEMLIV